MEDINQIVGAQESATKAKDIVVAEKLIDIDLTEIEQGKAELLAECAKLVDVKDLDSCNLAAAKALEVKNKISSIDLLFSPYENKIAAAKRTVEAARVSTINTHSSCTREWNDALAKLNSGMLRWHDAEKARVKKENDDREAADRKAADDARLAAAVTLESIGDTKAAEQALTAPVVMAPPRAVIVPKVAGVSFRTYWRYRASSEPLDPAYTKKDELGFTVPDHALIQATVTQNKANTKIRGVEVFEKSGTAS